LILAQVLPTEPAHIHVRKTRRRKSVFQTTLLEHGQN
jgi:hypothetical protein